MATRKAVLVTGANKGIGLHIARGLASAGYEVLLGCRNVTLGNQAWSSIVKETPTAAGVVLELDITQDASVAKAAAAIVARHPQGLDALVNNAGVMFPTAARETFGHQAEVTLGVNYFGTQRVSQALFPLLKPGSIVVNVTSRLGLLRSLQPGTDLRQVLKSPSLTMERLDAMMREFIALAAAGKHAERGWPNSAYGTSKIGENALTRLQAEQHPTMKVVAYCPGWCKTDMGGQSAPLTAEGGADTAVWLVTNSAAIKTSGGFWAERAEIDY